MPAQTQDALLTTTIVFSLIGLAVGMFMLVCWWRIFAKAGYSGAMSLLLLIPIANIIVFCMLAFGTWPVHQELNELRQRANGMGGYPQNPQYQQYPQNPQYPQYPQNR